MSKLRKLVVISLALYYQWQLGKDQWKDPRQLKEIQFKKLKAILKHAYDYVPYYHKLLVSLKLKPEDIKTYDDLKRIPPVSKKVIQQNYNEFIAINVPKCNLRYHYTSGSTGIPLKIAEDYSLTRSAYHQALNEYPFFESGVKLGDKFLLISARSQPVMWPNKHVTLLRNIPIISVPLFKDEEKLVQILNYIQPDVIWSFPQSMELLVMKSGLKIAPRLFISQGGTVQQNLRDVLERKFGTEVFETYGSVEFGHMAFECKQHMGLHQITGGSYLEFIDKYGEHVAPGEEGEIVVTGLCNYVMPLIRYRIGDLGIPSDEECTCGRSLPLIKSIQGRLNDLITLPSGRKVSVAHIYPCVSDELKHNVFCISQYQIIQERVNELMLKVTKGSEFDATVLNKIKKNIETYFKLANEEVYVSVEIVDRIPIDRTGKRRYIISKLNYNRL